MTAALPALAELQHWFGELLRTPLERHSGTLMATAHRPDPALCGRLGSGVATRSGLAVYNQHYWFRLLGVVQSEYRLFAALLGERLCSEIAGQFFAAHPPRSIHLAAAGEGLRSFVERTLPEQGIELENQQWLPRHALGEAIEVDAAFQRVFYDGPQPPLRLSPGDAAQLSTVQLVLSPAAALIDEHWPLIAVRRRLMRDRYARAALPPPHAAPRAWALVAKARGVRILPLLPLNARLLRELATRPVGAAIAAVEAACSPADASQLARDAEVWLARSIELGMWSGAVRGSVGASPWVGQRG